MSRPLRPPASTGRRCGTVTVAGQTLSVTQVGTNCSYQLQSPSTAFPPAGGTASLGVLTATGCMWTASSGSSWLHVARPAVKGETAFLLRGRRRIDEKRIFQSCPNRHSFGPLLPPGFKGSRRTTHSVILYRPTCRFSYLDISSTGSTVLSNTDDGTALIQLGLRFVFTAKITRRCA
jgi:hypothetical protein